MILVIGGRSKIGAALITELLDRGEQVRALVRAGEATGGLSSGGLSADGQPAAAETVTGDLADEGSLVTAMAGVEKVFLLSSPHPDAVSWHRNAIDAARRTQVQLLVRSSILGADRETPAEFISAHTTCDRYLEDSGLPYVIVRPNLFLQNVPESTIPSIDESGTFYADVAARLTGALGRHIGYADVPDDAVRQALIGAGLSEWFADALTGLYQDYRRSGTDGYAAQVSDTVPQFTGRPARSLDDLLAEIASLSQ